MREIKSEIALNNGKVLIELTKEEAKILCGIGDYAYSIKESFDDAVFFEQDTEKLQDMMKGLHFSLLKLFPKVQSTQTIEEYIRRKNFAALWNKSKRRV
jgi:hypothetical protein